MPYQGTFLEICTGVSDTLRLETDDLPRVKQWVNLAYAEVAQQTGCFQQTSNADLTTGISTYDLPTAVSFIKQVVIVYQNGAISNPMKEMLLEEILEFRRNESSPGGELSNPMYAMAGMTQIELWPEPTTGQEMSFIYSYLPDELVNDADVPLLQEPWGSDLLEAGALVRGAQFKKDPLISNYQRGFTELLMRFQQWLNRRQTGSSRSFPIRTSDQPYVIPARDVG